MVIATNDPSNLQHNQEDHTSSNLQTYERQCPRPQKLIS